jgi:hypothetical protein
MQNGEVLIPIFLFLGAFAMIFGLRYLANKENMALIDKGMNPKINQSQPRPYKNLKFGLLLMGAGIGLLLAFLLDEFALQSRVIGNRHHDHDFPAIYFALIGIFGGLGLIISYRIEKKEVLDKGIISE